VGKTAKGKGDDDKAAPGKASMNKFLSKNLLPKFTKYKSTQQSLDLSNKVFKLSDYPDFKPKPKALPPNERN